jgi:N-acyl-D-aspartate/D-glutamate deacylase
VPLIPHSMLRIEAMGTAAAVSREPTSIELARM